MDWARRFDEDAALLATSWGKFQVMGFNFLAAGFRTVSDFVQAQYENELQHLMAFLGYVKFNGIDDELRRHDWVNFARLYDGAGYKINKYDEKLAAAYKKYS
jgi:ferritin